MFTEGEFAFMGEAHGGMEDSDMGAEVVPEEDAEGFKELDVEAEVLVGVLVFVGTVDVDEFGGDVLAGEDASAFSGGGGDRFNNVMVAGGLDVGEELEIDLGVAVFHGELPILGAHPCVEEVVG